MSTMTSKPLRTLAAGAILSALALSFATVSSAGEPANAPQASIKLSDLDVSTSSGAVVAYDRIHNAAVDVCSRMYNFEASYGDLQRAACIEKVTANTVTRVNRSVLTAVFESKNGISRPAVVALASAP